MKSGLLLIDVQGECLASKPPLVRDYLIRNIYGLIAKCSRENIPVFNTFLDPAEYGVVIFNDTLQESFVYNERKFTEDAFFDTTLDTVIKSFDLESLIIAGVNASSCVKETVKSAVQKDYLVSTARDIIADPDCLGPYCPTGVDFFKRNGIYANSWLDLF